MPVALPLVLSWQSRKFKYQSPLCKVREWGHIMRRNKLLAENPSTVTLTESRLKNETLNDIHDIQKSFHFEQIWKVIPSATPNIIRKCARCNENRFYSSDKFRVNANKKVIDVWLIYKCIQCDFTLKLPIITRTTVSKIDRILLQRLQENDQTLAWQYAFDASLLQGMQMAWEMDFAIQVRADLTPVAFDHNNAKMLILINSEYFLKIPIFSILRKKLDISRNQLQKLEEVESLRVCSLKGDELSLKNLLGAGCILSIFGGITIPPSLTLVDEAL